MIRFRTAGLRRYLYTSYSMKKSLTKQEKVVPLPCDTGLVSEQNGQVLVKIQAKPGAKSNSITDIGEEVGVQIAAPPVDGEANTELIKYLSKLFGLKRSQVQLEKGAKSRSKTIQISGSSKDFISEKLQTALENQ